MTDFFIGFGRFVVIVYIVRNAGKHIVALLGFEKLGDWRSDGNCFSKLKEFYMAGVF